MATRDRRVGWRGGVGGLAILASTAVAALAQGPGGTLVVVNKNSASASVIDVETGSSLAVLPTGDGPHELALSSDGRTAVATNYGGQSGGNTLTVIDVPSASLKSTLSLGQFRRPHGAAFLPGDSLLAVTSETSEAVVIVRLADGSVVRTLRTGQRGSHMLAVTADGRTIFTGNIGDNTVTELDAVEGQKRLFQVPEQPEAITVTADGSEVWVGSNTQGRVSVVRTRDGSVETPFTGFDLPYRIVLVPASGRILVPDAQGNTLRIFDLHTHKETGKLDFPDGAPQGITVTPDGLWAFQSLSGENRVALVDLGSMAVVRYLETGPGPDGVAWSPLVAHPSERAAASAAQPQADQREAVMALVRRLFDGMREADSAKVRSTMAEGARFAVVTEREGSSVIEYQEPDAWISAVGGSQRRWDERVTDVVVHVDQNVASAWAPYSFYLDGELHHCGVDSMEFLRSSEGWKITQLSDTRRTEGCRDLPASAGREPGPRLR